MTPSPSDHTGEAWITPEWLVFTLHVACYGVLRMLYLA